MITMWFKNNKNENFQGFQVFYFVVYPKLKTRKSYLLLFISNLFIADNFR